MLGAPFKYELDWILNPNHIELVMNTHQEEGRI